MNVIVRSILSGIFAKQPQSRRMRRSNPPYVELRLLRREKLQLAMTVVNR
jgi:hypothetical protein